MPLGKQAGFGFHHQVGEEVPYNTLSYHQHNGKTTISSLFFNNIMESPKSDIFDPFFFNNIMEVTFIFSPRVFGA
jgi:hypothetical protein